MAKLTLALVLAFCAGRGRRSADLEKGTDGEQIRDKGTSESESSSSRYNLKADDKSQQVDTNVDNTREQAARDGDRTADEGRDGGEGDEGFEDINSNGGDNDAIDNPARFKSRRSAPSHISQASRKLRKLLQFVLQTGPDVDESALDRDPTYRWLPIFSGIVIPFSILLEIPGLTENWYIITEDNKTVFSRKNSALLDTGLAFSMACALIANIAIITRFMEKRIRTCTLIAIAALSIHDIINIVAVTYFGVIHRFNDGFTYGQSFWFTVCSTIASVATNISLIIDYVRTPDFAYASSGLTRKQRSLVIIVMILLCWIAIGALINGILMSLTFIEGLYFTVTTIETIGFGDIFPKSPGAKVFAGFHAVVGVLFLTLAVATCNDTIIESFQHSYRKHMENVRERRRERKAHRAKVHARKRAFKRQLERAGAQVYVTTPPGLEGGKDGHHRHWKRRLNIEALSAEQREDAEKEAEFFARKEEIPLSRRSTFSSVNTADTTFEEEDDLQKEFAVKLTVVWTLFLTFWLIGAVIFMKTENWTFWRGMWFCFEAFSTIGYGDQTPKSPAGQSIFIVWALLGVGTMTILISVISEACSSRYKKKLLTSGVSSPKEGGDPSKIFRRTETLVFRPASPMADLLVHVHEPAASPTNISHANFRRQILKRRQHLSLPDIKSALANAGGTDADAACRGGNGLALPSLGGVQLGVNQGRPSHL